MSGILVNLSKELASAQLSPVPEVREQVVSPPPPDLYPVLLLQAVFNQMTYPREWWGHVLVSAFALFCFFPACENMNFVSLPCFVAYRSNAAQASTMKCIYS